MEGWWGPCCRRRSRFDDDEKGCGGARKTVSSSVAAAAAAAAAEEVEAKANVVLSAAAAAVLDAVAAALCFFGVKERQEKGKKVRRVFFFDCFFSPLVCREKSSETSKSSPWTSLFPPHLDRLVALGPRRGRAHELPRTAVRRARGERTTGVRSSDGHPIRACRRRRRGRERVALSRRRDCSSCCSLGVDRACRRRLDLVPRSLERRHVGGRGGVLLSFVVVVEGGGVESKERERLGEFQFRSTVERHANSHSSLSSLL